MTKTWKLKINSSNILLVLITLILIKAEWSTGQTNQLELSSENEENSVQIYIGNNEIAQFFFDSSANNNSLILEDINKCLDTFQLVSCLKMLLLDRLNNVISILGEPNVTNTDLYFFKGLLAFKRKNTTKTEFSFDDRSDHLSLDEEISVKVLKLFQNRFLQINLLPRISVEVEPVEPAKKDGDNFICFSYKIQNGVSKTKSSENEYDNLEQGRKKRKGGGGMSMMMMLPQLIMLGFMPFTLASLKAMVMNAVMINMMALNGAIFMTIRNLVFGPRQGDNVKYVNYGYSKNRQSQSPKPVLIIHSPAAFVKQPKVYHKKSPDRRPSVETYVWDPETGQGYFKQSSELHENHDINYHISQESYSQHNGENRRKQTMHRRNDLNNSRRPINYFKNNLIHSFDDIGTSQRIQKGNQVRNQREKFSSKYTKYSTDLENKSTRTNPTFGVKKTDFIPHPQWDPFRYVTADSNQTDAKDKKIF